MPAEFCQSTRFTASITRTGRDAPKLPEIVLPALLESNNAEPTRP